MKIICPKCHSWLDNPISKVGEIVKCRLCKTRFIATEWSGVILPVEQMARYRIGKRFEDMREMLRKYFYQVSEFINPHGCETFGLKQIEFSVGGANDCGCGDSMPGVYIGVRFYRNKPDANVIVHSPQLQRFVESIIGYRVRHAPEENCNDADIYSYYYVLLGKRCERMGLPKPRPIVKEEPTDIWTRIRDFEHNRADDLLYGNSIEDIYSSKECGAENYHAKVCEKYGVSDIKLHWEDVGHGCIGTTPSGKYTELIPSGGVVVGIYPPEGEAVLPEGLVAEISRRLGRKLSFIGVADSPTEFQYEVVRPQGMESIFADRLPPVAKKPQQPSGLGYAIGQAFKAIRDIVQGRPAKEVKPKIDPEVEERMADEAFERKLDECEAAIRAQWQKEIDERRARKAKLEQKRKAEEMERVKAEAEAAAKAEAEAKARAEAEAKARAEAEAKALAAAEAQPAAVEKKSGSFPTLVLDEVADEPPKEYNVETAAPIQKSRPGKTERTAEVKKLTAKEITKFVEAVHGIVLEHGMEDADFEPVNPYAFAVTIPPHHGAAAVARVANDLFHGIGILPEDVRLEMGEETAYCQVYKDDDNGCYSLLFNHPAALDFTDSQQESMFILENFFAMMEDGDGGYDAEDLLAGIRTGDLKSKTPDGYLVLKGEFYDAIEAGTKKVEYRDFTAYNLKRTIGLKTVRFNRGYGSKGKPPKQMRWTVDAVRLMDESENECDPLRPPQGFLPVAIALHLGSRLG